MRAGTVAILGRPNVGKSTLLNRLLGQKLAAVTPRPQTTRQRLLGVKNLPAGQIAFIDTPGVHKARGGLNRFMIGEAFAAIDDADLTLLLIEAPSEPGAARASDPGEANRLLLERARASGQPTLLAINKVDRLRDKTALLPFLAAWERHGPFAALVPISARRGDGVDRLLGEIIERLPEGPPLFQGEMLTDRTERFLAAELVREQAFLATREEVPYAIAVVIDRFTDRGHDGAPIAEGIEREDVAIEATIFVERDSQKGILVGKGGATVKRIGMAARQEIAELVGCPVHLWLRVDVEAGWSSDPAALARFGYVPS